MARLKRNLILVPAAVFSIAGVLSLFPSPAAALDDVKCQAWADEIKNRVLDIVNDTTDFEQGTIRGNNDCPNLCEFEADGNEISVTPYLRIPAGVLAATVTDIVTSPGDKLYGTNVQGTVAFFCAGGNVVVGVGHPAPTSCGTEYTEICRPSQ
jgi:hypothetical protein